MRPTIDVVMQQLIQYIRHSLSGSYSGSEAFVLSRLILEEVYGIPFWKIAIDKNTDLSASRTEKLEEMLRRLQNGEPYQYVFGKTEFCGLPFVVTPDVLIPRPETEELVEWIAHENVNPSDAFALLDVGTGSGCIAVALAKAMPRTMVSAWDISREALAVAAENAHLNDVEVCFSEQDLFLPLPPAAMDDLAEGGPPRAGTEINPPVRVMYDVIVSNPPYVTESEKKRMAARVVDFEPSQALFVPDNAPLLFYERIADIASDLLRVGGKLYFEINRSKGAEVCRMLSDMGFGDVELREDISGNDRMVRAVKTEMR